MKDIEGTSIMAGKKNEVLDLTKLNANLTTNNNRQVYGKIPGVSVWENDGSGIQTGISTRGLSPNRAWEFNVLGCKERHSNHGTARLLQSIALRTSHWSGFT
jgi:Fe(3+) dicitrate transport protein